MTAPLLEVKNLTVRYPVWGGVFRRKVAEVRAVDDVSFTLNQGEVLGLVGESGCGKSTAAKAIVNLLTTMAPGVVVEGKVIYHAEEGPVDLLTLSNLMMRPYRADLQMIFQDPYSSLNPRMTVRDVLDAPLRIHTKLNRRDRGKRMVDLLEKVGLPMEAVGRYPHEFSGGQRQRIGIARALAAQPKIIIADEPVSALDVSVQAQVVNLMQDLQEEFGLTYLFVAHDLSVVHHISDRIAVMYLGKLVEIGPSDGVFHTPRHPYSQALLSAIPRPEPGGDRSGRVRLVGEIPNPRRKPSGCCFHTRCPVARPECSAIIPLLEPKIGGQLAACPYTA
ncbi:MAG: ABC transporter ATP-binding protein [Planctomycetia bacterium]